MNYICYIIGAARIEGITSGGVPVREGDYVIAADGGYAHLQQLGIKADLVLGDFDSLGQMPEHSNVIQHPKQKDDTDMLLAVRTGLKAGYRNFILLGGTGGRADHTYANFQVLEFIAGQGGRGYLYGDKMAATILKSTGLRLRSGKKGVLSVFSFGQSAGGVTLKGLKYELSEAKLENDMPLGVSNEFIGRESLVSVKRGSLLVMWNDTIEGILELIGDNYEE